VEEDERQRQQDIRAKFYNSPAVIKYIQGSGIPKRTQEFRRMVLAGSTEVLESKDGVDLIACLGDVTFRRHPQQINIMDKSSGKTIISIPL
jgi:hypothetical protein